MITPHRMRTFVALGLSEALVAQLTHVQAELRRTCERAGWRVSWVKPENLHLTLRFIGDTDGEQIEQIRQLMQSAASHPAPELALRGLGAFGASAKPKILFVQVHEAAGLVLELAAWWEGELRRLGFAPEPRVFRPHLTLGRVRHARCSLAEAIAGRRSSAGLDTSDFGTHVLRRLIFYRSTLATSPGPPGGVGPRYDALSSVQLACRRTLHDTNGRGTEIATHQEKPT